MNLLRNGEDFTGVTIVYFCHDGEGNMLMHKRGLRCRDEQGHWDCGGGGLEFGDTVEDTLRKEIAEEFGTDVLAHEFLGYRDVHRVNNGKKTHWIALDFKVLVDREKAHNAEPHKFDAIGWFPIGEFPEPRHSQYQAFWDRYQSRLY